MKSFLDEDFLLETETAKRLYHDFAKQMPIIDYHSHLPPQVLAKNENFPNMTQAWLEGDHYKWRAMRILGIEEKFITGEADDEEKFIKWASAVPYTMRNPLYHWVHLELKNSFGITELLSEKNAKQVYQHCNTLLKKQDFAPRQLLESFGVEMVGTTDDPEDDLQFHQQLANSSYQIKVLPSFRPDRALQIADGNDYRAYLHSLSEISNIPITNIDTLLEVLQNRVDYFHEHGCRVADHGLKHLPFPVAYSNELDKQFKQVLFGNDSQAELYKDKFTAFILAELCKMYHKKNWVQQFHLGPQRDNNSRMFNSKGANIGFDSIGDFSQSITMAAFFDHLDKSDQLTKTIIYNLNPADNAVFAAMTGNFVGQNVKGKLQFGAAWWFLDQLDGMTEQMNAISNMGLISSFIGMLTDSRSFLSYSRHEYFRRLLCNLWGSDVEKGLLPSDLPWIGKMVQDICYYNAKTYFNQ